MNINIIAFILASGIFHSMDIQIYEQDNNTFFLHLFFSAFFVLIVFSLG